MILHLLTCKRYKITNYYLLLILREILLKILFLVIYFLFYYSGIYQIQDIGQNDTSITAYSTMKLEDKVTFNPRALKNLALIEEIPSLSCINDMIVEDLVDEGAPQLYMLCGRGSRSTLRVLRHGLQVTEMANNQLPGKPVAIWTIKENITDEYDKYVIISFTNASLVLKIGEKFSEVTDSGFDLKMPSLHVGLLEDNSFIQVYPKGIIQIKADKKKNKYESDSKILCACSNSRQIVLALQDKEVWYFELDSTSGKLAIVEKKVLDNDVN